MPVFTENFLTLGIIRVDRSLHFIDPTSFFYQSRWHYLRVQSIIVIRGFPFGGVYHLLEGMTRDETRCRLWYFHFTSNAISCAFCKSTCGS